MDGCIFFMLTYIACILTGILFVISKKDKL